MEQVKQVYVSAVFSERQCIRHIHRKVYLPTYVENAKRLGLDVGLRREFDTEAQHIWESIGFDAVPLDGMEDLAHSFGAIHCITKVLDRSGYVPNTTVESAQPNKSAS